MAAKIPVILLAFANDKTNETRFLRGLEAERQGILDSLKAAVSAGLCELHLIPDATISKVVAAFQKPEFRDRISIFHFAGHAGSYHLALESSEGTVELAHAKGFAQFLGSQQNLQLVFLNGCSTQKQTDDLLRANIGAVISTSQSIDDTVATRFSSTFYQSMGSGDGISTAFREATAVVQIHEGSAFRDLYWEEIETPPDVFPWNLTLRPGAELVRDWNLPEASSNPLFGLPPLPEYPLPEKPFRYLQWYQKEDAGIFFGRAFQIRAMYDKVKALFHPGEDPGSAILRRPDIIHFFGQSGVGKSSLLAAGLLPRLEADFEIRYLRRHPEKGLTATLMEGIEAPVGKIRSKWISLERQKPLIVILDQLEEVFTRPIESLPNELPELIFQLQQIFQGEEVKGKMVLAYRKEYLAEVEKVFQEEKLAYSRMFLENLRREDIIEAILGITRTDRLRKKYNLKVEDGLPEMIADDLMEDTDAPVAPVLQILLSNLWERAVLADPENPIFSKALYVDLKQEGLWLSDFLRARLKELQESWPEEVKSGLSLDILGFHVSDKGTAASRRFADLETQYRHKRGQMEGLVRDMIHTSLLLDPGAGQDDPGRRVTRLAHDTLAPIIRKMTGESTAPGPQAMRVLQSRLGLNREAKWMHPLDPEDIALVENGKGGMRSLLPDEQHLTWSSYAISEAAENPTLSFLLARKADSMKRNNLTHQAVIKAFHGGVFYSDWLPGTDNIALLRYSPDGKKIFTAFRNGKAGIYDTKGKELASLETDHQARQVRFASDSKRFATVDGAGIIRLWNLKGKCTLTTGLGTDEAERSRSARVGAKMRSVGIKDPDVLDISFVPGGIRVFHKETGIFDRPVDKRKKEIIRFNPEAPIQGGFSQDGRYAVWANKEGDFCWLDLGLPDLEVISQLNDNLMGAGISASGDRAFGIREQSLSIRRIGEQYDGKSIKKNIQSGVRLLESNFDGTRLAIVMGDDTTWILNGYGDFLLRLSGYGGKVEDLAFGPDGKNLLMVASGRGYIWKGEANLAAGLFRGKRDLKNVIFRKEGLSAWFTYGPEIRAFDPRKGVVQKIISDAPSLDSLAISPDGSWLAAGTEDSSVIAWSVDGNEKFRIKGVDRKALISQLQDKAYAISQGGGLPGGALRTLVKSIKTHTDRILSIAISPDGKKVLTGSGDASVRLWNVSGKSLAVVHGLRFDDEIERLMEAESGGMFSQFAQTAAMPDFLSNIPVSRELSSVRLEDVEGHTDEVRCVAFAPDGKRFLSASADGRIGLWTLKGGKESLFRVSDAPLFSACFSPDGAHILAGDGKGELSFWDLKGNEVWRDRNAHTSAIRKVCYSPDGSKMLSASQDRTVMIRTAGGTPILRLERYLDWVFDADFSPDGKYVCTVDADRALRFWLIDPEDALLMGDQAELHTLTEEEKGRYGINLNI